jgi:hypothetical protein
MTFWIEIVPSASGAYPGARFRSFMIVVGLDPVIAANVLMLIVSLIVQL